MENGAGSYRRFLNGDKEAFVEIIKEYKDGLTFFLRSFVKDTDTAEELAQETFVRLYVRRPRFSGKSEFKTWLYGIARHAALDYIRRNRSQTYVPLETVSEESPSDNREPESVYFAGEEKASLHKAMLRLKNEYYQILWLVYFEEMDIPEASDVLKKSKNNTSVLLHRAKNALRQELLKEGKNYEEL